MTICGTLIGTAAVFMAFSQQEDALLTDIVERVTLPDWSDEKKVVALTSITNVLIQPRKKFFGEGRPSFRTTWLRSIDMELVEARGSCGSYTHVLARLLDNAGIQHRIFQIYCPTSGIYGCHIALEAKINGAWRSVDPLFNVVLPVSARQAGQDWEKYRDLFPADYNPEYRYADLRYTNWDKIPVIMPSIKSLLDWIAPEFGSTLSVRSYVINVYRNWAVGCLFFAILSLLTALALRKVHPRTIGLLKRTPSGSEAETVMELSSRVSGRDLIG